MKTIFVDMDGVLTDFESNYTKIVGMTPLETRQSRDSKDFSESWRKYVMSSGFIQQDWFPGGQELVEFLNKQDAQKCILSSSGGFKYHREVMADKLGWLRIHGIDWPAVIVPGRRYKAGFASATTALIDDTEDIITSFNARGGLGILHQADRKWESTFKIEQWLQ